MFHLPENAEIIFYSKPVRLLKGINSLSSVIQNEIGMDPYSDRYFLFCNKKRDQFKILYKDGENLAIWFKRFKGTLRFTYTNQIIILDKKGLLAFLEKTRSRDRYKLKNILT